MNLDRMLQWNYNTGKSTLRFKYYGDFETMKMIADDCINELRYIGNSTIDGSPIFVYTFEDITPEILRDFKLLNVYLRELKIRDITKKDLTKKEKSVLTFFNFFMNSDENCMIKGAYNYEIKPLYDYDDEN